MIFRRAKLRLALSFAAVQLALFAVFAIGVYAYVTTAFDFDPVERDATTAESGFATLRTGLLIAYAALVLVVPLTSYALASLAIRPLRASFEAQQRFVDDASHEFRTPLSAIQAQLELALHRRRTAVDYRAAITRSLGSLGRLNHMIDELLLLSHGQRPASLPSEPVQVGAIIAGALDALGDNDRARVDLTPSASLSVEGSASMLSRAALNLMMNALRYSPDDSRVTVGATRHGSFARIRVEDRGHGMSRRERRRASERFWRADSSRSRPGSGLGLSIAEELVRLHGGRLRLLSEPGIGTIAEMDIPLTLVSHPLS